MLLSISLLEDIDQVVKDRDCTDLLSRVRSKKILKRLFGKAKIISVTELKGRKIGVAVVCALCTVLSTVLSLLCTIRGSFSISGKKSLKIFLTYFFFRKFSDLTNNIFCYSNVYLCDFGPSSIPFISNESFWNDLWNIATL